MSKIFMYDPEHRERMYFYNILQEHMLFCAQ